MLKVKDAKSIRDFIEQVAALINNNPVSGCCVMLVCDGVCTTHHIGLEDEDFLIASRLFKECLSPEEHVNFHEGPNGEWIRTTPGIQ